MHDDQSNWKKFTPGYRGPRKSHMHVSINRRGKIQLNTFLMETLDYPGAVTLYYDQARSLIGIKPAERTDEDALPVNLREDRRYGEVHGLSFLLYNNIEIGKTIATNYIDTTPDGMLVMDLAKAREVRRKGTSPPGSVASPSPPA